MRSQNLPRWLLPPVIAFLLLIALLAIAPFHSPSRPVGWLESGREQAGVLGLMVVATWGAGLLGRLGSTRPRVKWSILGATLCLAWAVGVQKTTFGLVAMGIAVVLALLSLPRSTGRRGLPPTQGAKFRSTATTIGTLVVSIALAVAAGLFVAEWLFEGIALLSRPLFSSSLSAVSRVIPENTPGLYTLDVLWRAGLVPLLVLGSRLMATQFTILGRRGLAFSLIPLFLFLANPPMQMIPWLSSVHCCFFVVWMLEGDAHPLEGSDIREANP